MADMRTLDILLREIAKEGNALTTFLDTNSYYQPSFRPGGLGDYPELPDDVRESRRKLRDAAKAVYDLATGPSEYVRKYSWTYHDNTVLQWLVHFHIPQAVPLQGSITYSQVAKTCDVDEVVLKRVLRYAMLDNLFYAPSPEEIAHTPFSAVLVTDFSVGPLVEYNTDEAFPASTKVVEAYNKWGASEEPNHNAWCLANGTDLSIREYLAQPESESKAERFARVIKSLHDTPPYDLKHTVEGYDWKIAKGSIVDIGGGTGQTAIALARAHPELAPIIVEDVQHIIEKGENELPNDLKSRVQFTATDSEHTHPEAVNDAQLFILRLVLHDYSDKYARRILRNLLPSLEAGAKLVVIDSIMPAPGSVGVEEERALRRMDMDMMLMFSAREREMED